MTTDITITKFNVTLRKSAPYFTKGFKTKTADFRMAQWDRTNPVGRVASITNDLIKTLHDRYNGLLNAIDTLMPSGVRRVTTETIWIYDLNDANGPKNCASVQTLSELLGLAIADVQIGPRDEDALKKLWCVALCYFHWALVTPGIYHATSRVIVSRGKSSRYWCCVLAPKIPSVKPVGNGEIRYKGPSHKRDVVIPRLAEKIGDIEQKMEDIIRKEDVMFDKVQIDDRYNFSMHINEYLDTSGKYYVGANSSKKLNRLYQDLQRLRTQMQKVVATTASQVQSKLIMEDGSVVKFKQERKPGAAPPAKDARAAEQAEVRLETVVEEEVPDCWEDLDM